MNDLPRWRELCEWLDRRPSKCAHRPYMPRHLQPLVSLNAPATHRRQELALVYHVDGQGWRLRKDWQEKLNQLEEVEKETT